MKKPDLGNNCSVAIGYFGSFHTENITNILTSPSISNDPDKYKPPMFGHYAFSIPPLYFPKRNIGNFFRLCKSG